MVYYRRTTRRRRTRRTSRFRRYRRRFNGRFRYNKRGQRLYMFKRFTGQLGFLNIASLTPTFQGYNFSLNDLPNSTEFTSLFDEYRINAVKVSFIPQMTENVSLGSINNANAAARFFSVIDYNDSSNPTSLDELRQYQTCKMTPILKTHKRFIYKPKLVDSISSVRSPWVSTSAPSANYNGLRVGVEEMASSTTTIMIYNVEAVYYMSFRQVK